MAAPVAEREAAVCGDLVIAAAVGTDFGPVVVAAARFHGVHP